MTGERLLLERSIGGQPVRQAREVDRVGVELGPVDAGVPALAVDRHAAPAAHPRPVDHDRVERGGGPDPVRAGQLGHRAHHRDGADGEDLVDRAGVAQVPERFGDEPVAAVAPVIGGHVELVARGPGFVLEDEHLFRPGPDDGDDPGPFLFKRLGYGVKNPDSHAAADADGRFDAVDLRGVPQGPQDMLDDISGVELRKLIRRLPDDLVDDRQRPLHRVGIDDGQRDPLAFLVDHENDELPGLSLFRDVRRLKDRLDDVLR